MMQTVRSVGLPALQNMREEIRADLADYPKANGQWRADAMFMLDQIGQELAKRQGRAPDYYRQLDGVELTAIEGQGARILTAEQAPQRPRQIEHVPQPSGERNPLEGWSADERLAPRPSDQFFRDHGVEPPERSEAQRPMTWADLARSREADKGRDIDD